MFEREASNHKLLSVHSSEKVADGVGTNDDRSWRFTSELSSASRPTRATQLEACSQISDLYKLPETLMGLLYLIGSS